MAAVNTESIVAEWKSLEQHLNQRFQTNEAFRWITKQSGGKLLPAHVCLGAATLTLLLIAFNIGAGFLTTAITAIYPAYQSLLTIQSADKKAASNWLAYWVIFAVFSLLEQIADPGNVVSFYYLAKLMFLVWCFLPSTKGAEVVYERVLKEHVAQLPAQTAAGKME